MAKGFSIPSIGARILRAGATAKVRITRLKSSVAKQARRKLVRDAARRYSTSVLAFGLAVSAVIGAHTTLSYGRIDYFRYVSGGSSSGTQEYPATLAIYMSPDGSSALQAVNSRAVDDVWSVVLDSRNTPATLAVRFGPEESITDVPSSAAIDFVASIPESVTISFQVPEGAVPVDANGTSVERGWCASWVYQGLEDYAYFEVAIAPGNPTIFSCSIPRIAEVERLTVEASFAWAPSSASPNIAGKASYAVANPANTFYNGLQFGAIEAYARPQPYLFEFVNSAGVRLEGAEPQAVSSTARVSRWAVLPGSAAYLAVRSTPQSEFADLGYQMLLIAAGAFFAIGAERLFNKTRSRKKRQVRKRKNA